MPSAQWHDLRRLLVLVLFIILLTIMDTCRPGDQRRRAETKGGATLLPLVTTVVCKWVSRWIPRRPFHLCNNRIFPGASSSSFLLLHYFDTSENRKPAAARGEQRRHVLSLRCARRGSTLKVFIHSRRWSGFFIDTKGRLNPLVLQKWYQVAF
jgi:hypothetical protein